MKICPNKSTNKSTIKCFKIPHFRYLESYYLGQMHKILIIEFQKTLELNIIYCRLN